jgi:hypothetical protein
MRRMIKIIIICALLACLTPTTWGDAYTKGIKTELQVEVNATHIIISGNVSDFYWNPISGVVMNGLPGPPTTDATGFYESVVSTGWSGKVVPSKHGYIFRPASFEYLNITTDQTNQIYIGFDYSTCHFAYSGSWTGAGHGADGWYVGDFNGDGMDDIFRYVPGISGAQVFLSDGTQFLYAGSWTGAGHGTDGWYVGDFCRQCEYMSDIFRYLPGASGADVFVSDEMQFNHSGSWTGAGHGTDGWYIGNFNRDDVDDIFRYIPGTSGADVFLSDEEKFVHMGTWTGAGHGTDGWYVGDFDGDGYDDIFRYLPGFSGADMFLATCSVEVITSIAQEGIQAFDEDMMLDMYGLRENELSYQEEIELLIPFMERVMMGDEVSIYEIKKAYEDVVEHIVRIVKIRQLLSRHGYWDMEGQFGQVKKEREKKDKIDEFVRK